MTARRFFGAALLALQLGGLSAPWAEARLEAGPGPVTHVEAQGDGPCVPTHDHQACVLCQHLASVFDVGPDAPVLPGTATARAAMQSTDGIAIAVLALDPNPIRGPPIVRV